MSEWIQPPVQIGKEYNSQTINEVNKPKSKFAKIGQIITKLVSYKPESLANSQEVYEYFARISDNNDNLFNALVNEFNNTCNSNGFDFAIQELINSILSGDLPRPKGLANSLAFMPNPEYYASQNGYNNIINSSDSPEFGVQDLKDQS